jgi:hypothetical protein
MVRSALLVSEAGRSEEPAMVMVAMVSVEVQPSLRAQGLSRRKPDWRNKSLASSLR